MTKTEMGKTRGVNGLIPNKKAKGKKKRARGKNVNLWKRTKEGEP